MHVLFCLFLHQPVEVGSITTLPILQMSILRQSALNNPSRTASDHADDPLPLFVVLLQALYKEPV